MRRLVCKGRRLLDRQAMIAFSAFGRSNSVPMMAMSVLADIAVNHETNRAVVRSCDL